MAQYAGTFKPPFKFKDYKDFEAHSAAEDKWVKELKAELRAKNKGDLVGEEVRWAAGDGYARYLIVKLRPLTLVHLNVGDGWHAPSETIRGFLLRDATARVESDRKAAALRVEE